ncbi:MAG: glycosyltransferase family 2 protein, partial [Pseudomonadota bacterium]
MTSPGSSAPTVAVLILNYNGRDVTLQTLESMTTGDYRAATVFVIDNGCTDDSVASIETQFPEVRQLHVRPNKGISWGLNHGIQHALENGFDYLLLCNNDIEVAPDMISRMVEVAEADPKIGCVGPKSYYYSDRERLWSAGGMLRFRESITRERGDGELDQGQFDRDEEVDYINGCAMLVRAEAAQTVGFWDPVYFLGVEDADYCVRLKDAGYRCVYAHRARLWHMISHSIGVY